MDRLKVPDPFAGGGVQRQDAITKQVISFSITSVRVRGGRCQWDEDHPALMIDTQDGPRVHTSAILPGVSLPSVMAELARLGNSMELPDQLARARIESTDGAAGTLWLAVRNKRPGDHQIPVNRHGRSQTVAGAGKFV